MFLRRVAASSTFMNPHSHISPSSFLRQTLTLKGGQGKIEVGSGQKGDNCGHWTALGSLILRATHVRLRHLVDEVIFPFWPWSEPHALGYQSSNSTSWRDPSLYLLVRNH